MLSERGGARLLILLAEAEALSASADWFVTLDRRHFLDKPGLDSIAVRVGTPGDCVAWLRARWSVQA